MLSLCVYYDLYECDGMKEGGRKGGELANAGLKNRRAAIVEDER